MYQRGIRQGGAHEHGLDQYPDPGQPETRGAEQQDWGDVIKNVTHQKVRLVDMTFGISWVKTDDYWNVYWDVTRAVKMRFDEEGISIPFPQRDVHIYEESKIAEREVPREDPEES